MSELFPDFFPFSKLRGKTAKTLRCEVILVEMVCGGGMWYVEEAFQMHSWPTVI